MKVEPGTELPLVGLAEIAHRSGRRKASAVANWRDRYPDFPAPVSELACGPIFWWPHVEVWLRSTERL